MPLTLVQTKTAGSGANVTTLSVVFTTPPVQNHLLLAWANSDSTGSMTSTGWNLARSAINSSGLYAYWKIAGASESSTVTWAPGNSASTEIAVAEYSGNDTVSPLDQTQAGTGSGGSVSTGTTAATTQADELAVAAFGLSAETDDPSAYTNSFVKLLQVAGLGTVNTSLAVATKALAATGAQTSTATIAGGNVPSGVMATYKAAGAPVAPPPYVPHAMPTAA